VSYDASVDKFFVAAPGQLPLSKVSVFGGNPIDDVGGVATGSLGKSAAYDETNGMVYTTDERPGMVGVAGFRPPNGGIDPSWLLSALIPLGAVCFAIILFVYLIARRADPKLRPVPEPKRPHPA
jgi:hypothetical protein